MSTLELIAVLFGLACVVLTIRQHIACWPTGLVMVTLYIVIFREAKLYSDMLLQVIYVFLQMYGWWAWLSGGPDRSPLVVTRVPTRQLVPWLVTCLAGTVAIGWSMNTYTKAAMPYIDAFAAVASLIAQWLMGRKRLESWLLWIVVDIVSIGMYLAKELYLTAGLYLLFLVLAVMGYVTWEKTLRVPASA